MAAQKKHAVDGDWEVSRRFFLPTMKHDGDGQQAAKILRALSGVNKVTTDLASQHTTVWYDVTQTSYADVIKILSGAGFPPKKNWWFRFCRSWYRFTESNMRDLAKAPKGACCNKPPIKPKR
jgi:hypothetical protein